MAHWLAHKAVWFPGRMEICGHRLPPLTLGHVRLLEIIESPFLTGGESVGEADLAQAVAILRLPWRMARFVMGRPSLMRCVASWAVWRVNDWHEEALALVKYIDDCMWSPEAYREDGEKDVAGVFGYASSFAMRLAWKLSSGAVPTMRSRVWDLGITEALAWAVTSAELSGRGFVTRDEVEMIESQAAQTVQAEATTESKAGE